MSRNLLVVCSIPSFHFSFSLVSNHHLKCGQLSGGLIIYFVVPDTDFDTSGIDSL